MDSIVNYIKNNQIAKILIVLVIVFVFLYFLKPATESFVKENLDNTEETTLQPVQQVTQQPSDSINFTQSPVANPYQDVLKDKPQLKTEELLPNYSKENEFVKGNPIADLLKEKNFLISGYHIGIDTISSSNKIPNYDLRSVVPIPKIETGPWMQSSYEVQPIRRQLEIGSF